MAPEAKINLRKATLHDVPLLQHWDTKPHVIDSDPNDDWHWEQELAHEPSWREQFIAHLDGTPIGFIQIIDPFEEESHYWENVPENLRAIDIWIGEAENLAKGYGTKMMQLAVEHCFKHPEVTAILVDPLESNTQAHRFYEKLGFRFVEKRLFGADRCLVYNLDRKDWNHRNKHAGNGLQV